MAIAVFFAARLLVATFFMARLFAPDHDLSCGRSPVMFDDDHRPPAFDDHYRPFALDDHHPPVTIIDTANTLSALAATRQQRPGSNRAERNDFNN
jgi:hypothetical protein